MNPARGGGVVLIGLMGSGKSAVGRALAARLEMPFLDLDQEISRRSGRTLPEIFARDGEDAFRDLESDTLAALAGLEPVVLAAGGGTPIRPRNWSLLAARGKIVWLDVDPDVAAGRVAGGDRPLLAGVDPAEKMRHLHAVRAPLYARADLRINAAQPVETVVAAIVQAVAGDP